MGELESIREITNEEPAPEADTPPPMQCPACGAVLKPNGEHPNGGPCGSDDGCPND